MNEMRNNPPIETVSSEALRSVMNEPDINSLAEHICAISGLTRDQAYELAGQTLIDESPGLFPAESEDIHQILRNAIDRQ